MNKYIIYLLKAYSTEVDTESATKEEQIEDSKRNKSEVESLRAGFTEDKYLNKNLKEVSKWAM